MTERRVMVIAYHFPPVAGVGVERVLKHVTYLPDEGWHPVVIAPANPAYRLVDPASVMRIPPGTEVHRAVSLEPGHLRLMMRRLRLLISGRSPASVPSAEPATEPTVSAATVRPHRGALHGALNAAWARIVPLVFFPDEQLLWAVSAAGTALAIQPAVKADALYSSSPPISAHLSAALVKRVTGLPWIADLRDPWIGNAFSRPLAGPHRALQRDLERMIVRGADRTVLATDALRDAYVRRYPQQAHRIVTITNGYDLAELQRFATSGGAPHRPFRLVYTGSVYGEDELRVFLDGLTRLVRDRPSIRDELRVEFVGWFNERNEQLATERFPALTPLVAHTPQVPRTEALARLSSADGGLILLADGDGQASILTAKLFDYLGLDLPVLAVAPPGELRRVLGQLDWGIGADPTPEGVAQGITALIEAPHPGRHADTERRFERRRLTSQLASLLDEVAPTRSA